MGTYFDYPDVSSGDLQSHPDQLYLPLHNAFANPDLTQKVSIDRLSDFAPTEIAPGSPYTLAGTEKFIVLVDSGDVANTVTVPNSQSCLIVNVSQSADDLEVITTGNANETLTPGESMWVLWDGAAAHDLTRSAGGSGSIILQDTVTTSANAVKSSGIKTYVDAVSTTLAALSVDHDLRAIVRAGDEVVVGSGSASTDATNMGNAVAALNAALEGTLWISGEVQLNSAHLFTIPPRIRALTSDAAFRVVHANAAINCGSSWVPITSAASNTSPAPSAINSTVSAGAERFTVTNPAYAFTATDAGDQFTASGHTFVNGNRVILSGGSLPTGVTAGPTYYVRDVFGSNFKLATTAGGTAIVLTSDGSGTVTENLILTQGDWVVLWSEDAITGVEPHYHPNGGNRNSPMEMHIIKRVDGSNQYSMGDILVDALTSTPKVRLVPVLKQPGANVSNALIEGLAIRQDAGITNLRLFDLRCLNGVTMRDCHWELNPTAGAPGHVFFNFCSNIKVENCTNVGTERYNTAGQGYWLEFGVVMGALVENCESRRCRHAVDTSAGHDADPVRYGTPRGLVVNHCIFYVEGDAGVGSLFGCSTHPEGYGVTFQNSEFHISGDSSPGHCLTARARKTIFQNNKVFGGGGGCKGVVITGASGCVIKGNEFYGVWRCVVLDTSGVDPDNCEISDNLIADGIAAGAIQILDGNGHVILRNTFRDHPQAPIEVEGPTTNNEIAYNYFLDCAASGTQAVIHYGSTGANSANNVNIHHNVFVDCNEIAIEFLGNGDECRMTHNSFHNCGNGASVIRLTGGKLHRICLNDIANEVNNNSINLGTNSGFTFTADDTTDVITAAGNTYINGNVVVVSSTTTLPAPLTANTVYYVRDVGTAGAGTFKLSATNGGSAINITSTGSGTHTVTECCQVTILGNVLDGYGSGSMGMTGTLASTLNTAYAAKNMTD